MAEPILQQPTAVKIAFKWHIGTQQLVLHSMIIIRLSQVKFHLSFQPRKFNLLWPICRDSRVLQPTAVRVDFQRYDCTQELAQVSRVILRLNTPNQSNFYYQKVFFPFFPYFAACGRKSLFFWGKLLLDSQLWSCQSF